ncbi:hypothetical protein PJ985_17845 [Streptomyces sp. ACA25]|uniref:carbonic anhydrase n=1 Tax=Streptomyces sp. ACA25 TaxID=3022596 RepID=UPI0023076B60|nr:carbonic anhydrase [Streptomyces sp. ACA25]MDB1089428.1 hypothetical protein [Streptomyces sp. ACA25]
MPERFATALTCIDGRIQRPLEEWVKSVLGVDYLDTVTEPGPDRVVSTADEAVLQALLDKVRVSGVAHGSTDLIIAGHSDCAGNPVSDDEHRAMLREAVGRSAARLPGVRVIAVHAVQCGDRCWQFREVDRAVPVHRAIPAAAPSSRT